MSSHKKHLAEKRKRRQKRLKKKMRPSFEAPPRALIIQDAPGQVKMSEVLGAFVKPYMEPDETAESLRKLLSLGSIAWNAALLPPTEREKLLRQSEETLPAETRDDLRAVLEPMIRRKQEHFADIRRGIIDFQLTMRPTGPHLDVMSTLEA